MLKVILMSGAVTCLGVAGFAQDTFSLPAGCDAYVTMQKRGCIVTHVFTCEGDPEGYQRRVDLGEEGLLYVGQIDEETQWIESFHPLTGNTDRLGPTITDPASFTELLATGRDDFDFETTSDLYGVTRYAGYDELTGNDLVVSGETLLGTAFDVSAYGPSGEVLWRVYGNEFIHPEWRTFLSGIRTITSENGDTERNNTPMEFAFPGEDGFLTSKPVVDCSVVLSRLEAGQ